MRACWLKWVGRDWSISADYIWLNYSGANNGIKAIIIYCLIMGSAFFHGWLYTTNTSVLILNLSQVWIPLVLILLFACFFHCNKQKIDSVGINTDKLKNSIILGVIGGIFLLVIQTVLFKAQGKSISFTEPLLINWIIFFFAALEEEIIFRGYIQTRLSGLIRNQWIVGIINSVLFLSIHYPVRWVIIGKLYFDVLPVEYVISLLALHFFCDAVYKRTNCLWGSVVLHIIYNAVGAMIAV